ncbi:hypothetical protein VL03_17090 [Rossellomorea marisflavi]|nr:hypothetical protein VL03_17090 [Rossellomorea marisflavi]
MDRSFPLQALAFRGEEVEPPQLRFRGLDLSSIPVGVKRLPLQCTLWCYEACKMDNGKDTLIK